VRCPESLLLLGKATGGVALFASGIVLFSRRVALSLATDISVLGRNIIVPAVTRVFLLLVVGFTPETTREVVLTMAIPTASICVIVPHFGLTTFFGNVGSTEKTFRQSFFRPLRHLAARWPGRADKATLAASSRSSMGSLIFFVTFLYASALSEAWWCQGPSAAHGYAERANAAGADLSTSC
jgi:hypothetical protein